MASEFVKAPEMAYALACYEPDGKGGVREVWNATGHNVVVNQGKGQLINRAFGFQTASTFGPFLAAHSASTASNHVWGDISASSLGSYGTAVPPITFGTAATVGSASASASYAFTAGTQTLSGFAMLWHTASTLAVANLSSTGGLAMYNNGSVAAQQIVANNTISVTVTLSMA